MTVTGNVCGMRSRDGIVNVPFGGDVILTSVWAVAPPGFCNRGGVRYGSIGGLEYEVPQKLTHLLQCIGNL